MFIQWFFSLEMYQIVYIQRLAVFSGMSLACYLGKFDILGQFLTICYIRFDHNLTFYVPIGTPIWYQTTVSIFYR